MAAEGALLQPLEVEHSKMECKCSALGILMADSCFHWAECFQITPLAVQTARAADWAHSKGVVFGAGLSLLGKAWTARQMCPLG